MAKLKGKHYEKLSAYQKAANYSMEDKLNHLLRYHRRFVFGESEALAQCHLRAIVRLKNTATHKTILARNEQAAKNRWEAQMDRLGY